ncbi:hypothetical protein Adt_12306 [Abeliophyllum distichum]|uniref:Uncharacterized protein n=1 Tax=Abeliophyllum distichum TaxID=126358 RepID=A0ABD1UQF2_9LAMI
MSDVERHGEVQENSGSDGEDLTFNESDFSIGEENDVLFEENVIENIELDTSRDLLSLVDRNDSETSKYDSSDELRSVNDESKEKDENQHGDGVGASSRSHVGEHVAYSQPASSIGGIEQQEILASFSQPCGSTAKNKEKFHASTKIKVHWKFSFNANARGCVKQYDEQMTGVRA